MSLRHHWTAATKATTHFFIIKLVIIGGGKRCIAHLPVICLYYHQYELGLLYHQLIVLPVEFLALFQMASKLRQHFRLL